MSRMKLFIAIVLGLDLTSSGNLRQKLCSWVAETLGRALVTGGLCIAGKRMEKVRDSVCTNCVSAEQ